MTVENQTYYSDCNQCQNYMCKNLAAATAIVKIGDHIPSPCKHREEHEHKVKDCQIIYEGKKGLDFLVLVQKPPCHVYDNVAAGSEMEKKASSLTAHFHLPGLFEFYDFYRVFLPLYRKHRDFFTTGARLIRFMARRKIVFGAVGARVTEERMQRKFFRLWTSSGFHPGSLSVIL